VRGSSPSRGHDVVAAGQLALPRGRRAPHTRGGRRDRLRYHRVSGGCESQRAGRPFPGGAGVGPRAGADGAGRTGGIAAEIEKYEHEAERQSREDLERLVAEKLPQGLKRRTAALADTAADETCRPAGEWVAGFILVVRRGMAGDIVSRSTRATRRSLKPLRTRCSSSVVQSGPQPAAVAGRVRTRPRFRCQRRSVLTRPVAR
jgi:hypothetical protein